MWYFLDLPAALYHMGRELMKRKAEEGGGPLRCILGHGVMLCDLQRVSTSRSAGKPSAQRVFHVA